MSFCITLIQGKKTFIKEYDSPILLTDAVSASGFYFDAPCGGKGICGNCKVIAHGNLSDPTKDEEKFLKDRIHRGERLACMSYAIGDAVIEIPTHEESVRNSAHTDSGNRFGCALDVGTTTLVFRYYSIPGEELVFSDYMPNPQRVRGADVLTRIEYASEGGLDELRELIENAIECSLERFGHKVERYIITGNTAMLHILSGKNPNGIATAPFEPETLFGFWEGNKYYMRCASAYIGADVIASLISSKSLESGKAFALLDIGTNNECILYDGKTLYACSSPAGPAFEGANISCGMTAREGAIISVKDDKGVAVLSTFEGISEPIGFCGSGLIDAVAFLLKNGYISSDGSLKKELPCFGRANLLGEDIAELQLAKAAVSAGLMTLCDHAGISTEDINTVYLTGSFGNRINTDNAEYIGLLPKGTAEKAVYVNNGAVDGAASLLINPSLMERSVELADSINTVELANSEFFAKKFIENLYF